MEALGALAVAERHIRALGTARADRGRSDDSVRFAHREHTSPFQSARVISCRVGHRSFHVETARVTDFVPGGTIDPPQFDSTVLARQTLPVTRRISPSDPTPYQ